MKGFFAAAAVLAVTVCASATQAATTYADRVSFEAALGTQVTDDYDSAYPAGFGVYDSAAMSAFLGETDYESTGFQDNNIIQSTRTYCAGCNGSFRLSFTTTSVGTTLGVFGVGLDIDANSPFLPYDAFVTFGDGSTTTFDLNDGPRFFGLTSPLLVSEIHFTQASGDTTRSGSFVIDDLTIGAQADPPVIPVPASLPLMVTALAGAVALARRRRDGSV